MARPPHREVRWTWVPIDEARDENDGPVPTGIKVRQTVTTYPTDGTGIRWSKGEQAVTWFDVPLDSVHGLVSELVSALVFYTSGDAAKDDRIERARASDG